MTEKEFRKLVTDLEMPRAFKDKVTKNLELIKENIPSMLKEAVLLDICKIGSIARSTMLNTEDSVDLMVVYKYSSSKSFKLVNQLIINALINTVAYLFEEIKKPSDVEFNQSLNVVSFNISDIWYNIYVRYEKENIEDIEFTNYKEIAKHSLFTEFANRDYTYFKNTVAIIKYFRNEQKINISGHILEVLLYYSLNEYFKDNHYETYLNAFIRGIDDFLKQKKICVSNDILKKLEVTVETATPHKGYAIIDPTDESVNLVLGITEIKLNDYRKLKKAISKVIDAGAQDLSKEQVVLHINPKEENGMYVWSYEIENSRYHTDGGSYPQTEENYITACLKALSKGLKTIVDNGLNKRGIKLVCKYSDLLSRSDLLSSENQSRRKTIIAYMEVNNITIAK